MGRLEARVGDTTYSWSEQHLISDCATTYVANLHIWGRLTKENKGRLHEVFRSLLRIVHGPPKGANLRYVHDRIIATAHIGLPCTYEVVFGMKGAQELIGSSAHNTDEEYRVLFVDLSYIEIDETLKATLTKYVNGTSRNYIIQNGEIFSE